LGEAFNKVPTVIACNYTNTTWGFEITQSQHDDGHIVVDDNFKLLLDQQILDEVNSEPNVSVTRENISKCFEIFLKNLYEWTNKQLEEVMDRKLQGMTVEYHFSVPATWKEGTVADYLAIIKKAGFGSVDGHMATISLNEAEAAAVHTAIYNSSLETDGYKV
jgi:hypothetical protein